MVGPGARLKDRYRLERLLGRGGMAAVWMASDEVLERPVAVKVLSDAIASDPEFLARFRREARVAAGLSHPNLIGVYDYAEQGERPYLVMEYVAGGNLADRIQGGGRFDCERLARELLGALAHIHAAGIVHRDVKPGNVLIGADGAAKLIDFGIALPRDATALTSTGNLLGTARYIAPEVMRGEPASERSDLYSSGVVLTDCLREENEGGPLGALVRRLSDPEPGRRPASARAALADLRTTRRVVSDRPTVSMPKLPPSGSAPGRAAPHRNKAAALAAGIAVFAGGFLVFANDAEQPRGGGDRTSLASESPAPERQAESAREPAPVPAPRGNDPALGAALNEEGFALIRAGRYEEAIPVLEESVRAFPAGTEDVNYAYALFNLGNALRLSGRPEDAIPVLERRLRIPDQTDVVREELAAARRSAS